jgi:D-threo-aldose 1-dehydrogenase
MIAERGIGLYLGGVYNSGILAVGARPGATYNYRPAPEAVRERVAHIEGVCTRHGVPLRAAALQFAAAHPAVTAPLFGAASPEEVREAIEGFQFPIPADLWDDLRADGLIPAHAPVPA